MEKAYSLQSFRQIDYHLGLSASNAVMILPIIIYVSDEVDCKLYLITTINPPLSPACKLWLRLRFTHMTGLSQILRKAPVEGVLSD